jgi:two-component system, OmpR family, heavy metal sensor histidine kinase CusS
MLGNAVVVLLASLAVLFGVRSSIRYTLMDEVDETLQNDMQEIVLELTGVHEVTNRRLHAQLDRKARVHTQRTWFVELATYPTVEDTELPDLSGRQESPEAAEGGTAGSDGASTSGTTSSVPPPPSDPQLIWSTYNAPDWSLRDVPPNFDKYPLPDGVPTTIFPFRVLEQTVPNALDGPVRVRLGASLQSILHGQAVIDRLMILHGLVMLIFAPLGGYWLAVRATKPLQEMIRTTDRLLPSNMKERLPIHNTDDEIDQLSLAFNSLLDRISDYLTKRQDFLANSAHELRTPLAALRSTAELALGSERSVDEYRELLDLIVTECSNLEQLVNQLLLLAESETADFETSGERVDVSQITCDACDMFEAVAESREIQLRTHIHQGVAVEGSRVHLRQLLNNLLDNAIKFTGPQGSVEIALSAEAATCRLAVRDTGIGIADEEQKRLFERFYRGDRARRRNTPTRGTGLGLSICRAIAEAHGGTISVQSQTGVGTCFLVTLPLASESEVS